MAHSVWNAIKNLIGMKPDEDALTARKLIDESMIQRAVFQLDFSGQSDPANKTYLLPRYANDSEIALESGKSVFVNPRSWIDKVFIFRFIMMQEATGTQAMYQFRSRIRSIMPRGDGIVLDLPAKVERIERRENFRIRLKLRHLPGIIVWGLAFQKDDEYAKRIHSNMILRLTPDMVETSSAIKNISSGGMRLALKNDVYEKYQDFISLNQNLKIKLVFDGSYFPFPVNITLIAKIRHIAEIPGATRVEMGLQFTRMLIDAGADKAWRKVGREGVDEIGRLLRAIQLEYYKELKSILESNRPRSN